MSTILQRYARNSYGCDFVVGDIHGCYDALRRALDDVDFVPETDRLFSVGDLIDRGPQSIETLNWLSKPWFHACIGNHEDMALRSLYDHDIMLSWVVLNGGHWWMTLDDATRREYRQAFRQLPVAMEIETDQGGVGIVHADIPQGLTWQRFLRALETGDISARETALWSRRRADGLVTTAVEGIDLVVCGHTITPDRSIHRRANVWFIDTGAFLCNTAGGHLTLMTLASLFQDGDPIAADSLDMP